MSCWSSKSLCHRSVMDTSWRLWSALKAHTHPRYEISWFLHSRLSGPCIMTIAELIENEEMACTSWLVSLGTLCQQNSFASSQDFFSTHDISWRDDVMFPGRRYLCVKTWEENTRKYVITRQLIGVGKDDDDSNCFVSIGLYKALTYK